MTTVIARHLRSDRYDHDFGIFDLDTVSVFVAKLYQLLENEEYAEYLRWDDTGTVFIIERMDAFAANVLPKFFKHCKFASFVRQLNIYGFYRVSDARKSRHAQNKNACVFSHPSFRRGRHDLLRQIRRRVNKTSRKRRKTAAPVSRQQSPSDEGEDGEEETPPEAEEEAEEADEDHELDEAVSGPVSVCATSVDEEGDEEDAAVAADSGGGNLKRKSLGELTQLAYGLQRNVEDMSALISQRLLPEIYGLTRQVHMQQEHMAKLANIISQTCPEGKPQSVFAPPLPPTPMDLSHPSSHYHFAVRPELAEIGRPFKRRMTQADGRQCYPGESDDEHGANDHPAKLEPASPSIPYALAAQEASFREAVGGTCSPHSIGSPGSQVSEHPVWYMPSGTTAVGWELDAALWSGNNQGAWVGLKLNELGAMATPNNFPSRQKHGKSKTETFFKSNDAPLPSTTVDPSLSTPPTTATTSPVTSDWSIPPLTAAPVTSAITTPAAASTAAPSHHSTPIATTLPALGDPVPTSATLTPNSFYFDGLQPCFAFAGLQIQGVEGVCVEMSQIAPNNL
ncbi:uncharacterized protein VTP21DRAFT_7406 [Calcarisporiella thermophila]|uniref:uncharacterized protein n=1 Tax=Calcarisporiella thermophila TaxID=911321 RepID=UPI003743D378